MSFFPLAQGTRLEVEGAPLGNRVVSLFPFSFSLLSGSFDPEMPPGSGDSWGGIRGVYYLLLIIKLIFYFLFFVLRFCSFLQKNGTGSFLFGSPLSLSLFCPFLGGCFSVPGMPSESRVSLVRFRDKPSLVKFISRQRTSRRFQGLLLVFRVD